MNRRLHEPHNLYVLQNRPKALDIGRCDCGEFELNLLQCGAIRCNIFESFIVEFRCDDQDFLDNLRENDARLSRTERLNAILSQNCIHRRVVSCNVFADNRFHCFARLPQRVQVIQAQPFADFLHTINIQLENFRHKFLTFTLFRLLFRFQLFTLLHFGGVCWIFCLWPLAKPRQPSFNIHLDDMKSLSQMTLIWSAPLK